MREAAAPNASAPARSAATNDKGGGVDPRWIDRYRYIYISKRGGVGVVYKKGRRELL